MAYYLHIIPNWLELIALAFCIGVLVCGLWIVPSQGDAGAALHKHPATRLRRSFGAGITALFACVIAVVLVRASEMGGRPILEAFPLIPTVVLKTHFGRAWLTRLVGIILLGILLRFDRYFPASSKMLFLMLGISVVISATESATGHAADAGDFSVAEIMDWLHLYAASVWGGGLMVLSFAIFPGLAGPAEPTLFAGIAGRFSRIAGLAVGLVAITAIYNGLSYVGNVEALWKSVYGWAVITKVFLFFLLINLGGFNRYVSVPLLQEWAGASQESRTVLTRIVLRLFPGLALGGSGQRIAARFIRGVKMEAILTILLLLCAALLRHEIPARHLSHMRHQGGMMHSMPHMGGSTPADHPDHQTP